ncbi:MAG: hypothetical protein AAGA68_24945 [Pseudomonadota bacterium]
MKAEICKAWTLYARGAICLFALLSSQCFAFGFEYRAYSGDLEGDGDSDLLVAAPAQFVLISTGGVLAPVRLRPSVEDTLLVQASGELNLVPNPTAAQLSAAREWTESVSGVWEIELDSDDRPDAFVNLGSEFAGVPDLLLFAGAPGARAEATVSLSGDLLQFIGDIDAWVDDRDYFLRTSGIGPFFNKTRRIINASIAVACADTLAGWVTADLAYPLPQYSDTYTSYADYLNSCLGFEDVCLTNDAKFAVLREFEIVWPDVIQESVDWSAHVPGTQQAVDALEVLLESVDVQVGDANVRIVLDVLEVLLGRSLPDSDMTRLDNLITSLLLAAGASEPEESNGIFEIIPISNKVNLRRNQAIAIVRFRVPENSFGTIVQRVDVDFDLWVEEQPATTTVASVCDTPEDLVGGASYVFYEAWSVVNGSVKRSRNFDQSLENLRALGFRGHDVFSTVAPSQAFGRYAVIGEARYFQDVGISSFGGINLDCPRSALSGGRPSTVTNPSGPPSGWSTRPFLGPRDHKLIVKYGTSNPAGDSVTIEEIVP